MSLQPVIVEVGEFGMPGGRRPLVAAGIGNMRGHADFAGDVAIDGRFAAPALVGIELLQLLVAHRGEEILRVARAVEIAFGDAHAVDRQMPPAVGARVEPRRLARIDAPHLLFAAAVILPVVGDAQRRHARLVPVGEQHRKRAEAGRERRAHGIVGLVAGLRTIERIVRACAPGRARARRGRRNGQSRASEISAPAPIRRRTKWSSLNRRRNSIRGWRG